jgi:hypothetical protein
MRRGFVAAVVWCLLLPRPVSAQTVEATPFGGYRFGGDFFELITGQPVDLDGAPAVGVALDLKLRRPGSYFEGLFTHQQAHFTVPPARPSGTPTRWHIAVDHWQGGGLQEFRGGQVRPFLTGMIGLTRYAAEGDSEIRFTLGAGGGVKLWPSRRLGIRLDGRTFATFVDAQGEAIACTPGICLVGFDADVVWQAEFTAGLVLAIR